MTTDFEAMELTRAGIEHALRAAGVTGALYVYVFYAADGAWLFRVRMDDDRYDDAFVLSVAARCGADAERMLIGRH